jgi:uncharacterized protein YecE (DUF72 family)
MIEIKPMGKTNPMATIYIGTSGFSYREWNGSFYPIGIKSVEMLRFYASQFNAVELNNTFYQLPSPESLNSWRNTTTPGFRFAVKASQNITHRRDYGMSEGYFDLFLSRIILLKDRLGPILFQFPPTYGDPERLEEFIAHLDNLLPNYPQIIPVVELRNKKLLNQPIFDILSDHHLNLCLNDAYIPPEEWPEPSEIIYLRLRNGPYQPDYLPRIGDFIKQKAGFGQDCHVFFKHEIIAPELARELLAILKSPGR